MLEKPQTDRGHSLKQMFACFWSKNNFNFWREILLSLWVCIYMCVCVCARFNHNAAKVAAKWSFSSWSSLPPSPKDVACSKVDWSHICSTETNVLLLLEVPPIREGLLTRSSVSFLVTWLACRFWNRHLVSGGQWTRVLLLPPSGEKGAWPLAFPSVGILKKTSHFQFLVRHENSAATDKKNNREKRTRESGWKRRREFIMQVADIISWSLGRFAYFHKREVAVCVLCVLVCVKKRHRRVKKFQMDTTKSY